MNIIPKTLAANPWSRLPVSQPFVLEKDRAFIEAFNSRVEDDKKIDVSLYPEPFLGKPDAPAVLLGLNPGWSPEDSEWHMREDFAVLSRDNLEHTPSPFPFYLLNPALGSGDENSAPGNKWWRRKLKSPINDAGLDAVANGLLCIEYFPYHSDKYEDRTPRVPSQEYGFELVRSAIARKAIIVIMRSRDRWLGAIPELNTYGRQYCINSTQNVAISEKNCPDGYSGIVDILKNGSGV